VDEWDRHSRIGHHYDDPRTPRIEGTNPPCAWMPIYIRRELWGAVHLLAIDSSIDEIDLLALDRTAAAIGLSLLSERDTGNLIDVARGALIFEILRGHWNVQDLLRHATRLGIQLEGRRLAALVVETVGLEDAGEPRSLSERERQRIQAASMKGVQEALADARCPALSAPDGTRILIIVGLPTPEPVRSGLDALARAIARRISERVPGLSVAVGASQEARPESIRSALEDAGEAASVATRLGTEGVQHFGDLGVLHLLMELAGSPELARFVESELGPLLQRDAKGASIWVPTLRAYLDAGGKKVLAADRLHIDRRTLYYRLDRIQRLLGRDLDDPDVRLRLEVALRSLDLLKSMATRSGHSRTIAE
jgi:PucR family transcriptional regulator, purine catabolism regulatory protein